MTGLVAVVSGMTELFGSDENFAWKTWRRALFFATYQALTYRRG